MSLGIVRAVERAQRNPIPPELIPLFYALNLYSPEDDADSMCVLIIYDRDGAPTTAVKLEGRQVANLVDVLDCVDVPPPSTHRYCEAVGKSGRKGFRWPARTQWIDEPEKKHTRPRGL